MGEENKNRAKIYYTVNMVWDTINCFLKDGVPDAQQDTGVSGYQVTKDSTRSTPALTRKLYCWPLCFSPCCSLSGDFSGPAPLDVPTLFCWFLVGITVFCQSWGFANTKQRKQPQSSALNEQSLAFTRQESWAEQERGVRGRVGTTTLYCLIRDLLQATTGDMCIPILAWETLINIQFQKKNKQQNLTVTLSLRIKDKNAFCFLQRTGWARFPTVWHYTPLSWRECQNR